MKNYAFTLAEVLITLGIIGIVAAMTLPTLIQKNNEKSTIISLKKIYSVIQQAFVGLSFEHGTPENWDIDDNIEFRDLMGEQLKLVKRCAPMEEGCWYNEFTKMIFGGKSENLLGNDNYSTAILSDGTIMAFDNFDKNCDIFHSSGAAACGQIIVDINGFKKPNQWGRDVFAFIVAKDRIIPRGWPEGAGVQSFQQHCLNVGHSCAGWAIINENLDYLHCNDLSWDGKRKCK